MIVITRAFGPRDLLLERSRVLALQEFNPNLHNAREVWGQWRTDSLEFLRHDVPRLLFILIVYAALIWILRMVTRRIRHISKKEGLPSGFRAQQLTTLASVVNGTGTFVFIFLGLIQILGVLQINVGPLLASAGIVGLAVGFGAQTLVHDVINGFLILLENQYDVGDGVKISGVQGTVEKMTLRRTVLRDADGTVHTVPNSQMTIVSNLTRDWTQLSLHIAVDYEENSDRVISILKEVALEVYEDELFHEAIVAEPEVPGIDRVTGEQVEYLLLVKTRPGQQYAVSRELRRKIKDCFERNDIKPGSPNRIYVVGDSSRPSNPS